MSRMLGLPGLAQSIPHRKTLRSREQDTNEVLHCYEVKRLFKGLTTERSHHPPQMGQTMILQSNTQTNSKNKLSKNNCYKYIIAPFWNFVNT